jgi:hypothetical protein
MPSISSLRITRCRAVYDGTAFRGKIDREKDIRGRAGQLTNILGLTVRTCGHLAGWIVLLDLRQDLECRKKI